MTKPKTKQKITALFLTKPLFYTGLALILVLSFFIAPRAKADEFENQIKALQAQNDSTKGDVDQLQLQASSYQDAINKLQQQINDIRAAIAANQAKQADLAAQIDQAEKDLAAQRKVLGESIRKMYLEGQISTLEMLASSKDLSDFVDKQQYRSSVQDKLKTTVDKITALKASLKTQKAQVEQLLATQQQQQSQLDADQSKQSSLLTLNQQQQDQYNQQIKDNSGKIATLRAQQAATNAAIARRANVNVGGSAGGSCDTGQGNGGYTGASGSQGNACNAAQDSIPDWALDDHGTYIPNRECTSYAYWYMNQVLGKPFRASGNAAQWIYTSNRPVDRTPEVGTIGVAPIGYYGHVMIIQAIGPTSYGGTNVPAGYVLVSNMNFDYNGHFSYNLWPANTLYYIH